MNFQLNTNFAGGMNDIQFVFKIYSKHSSSVQSTKYNEQSI